MTQSLLLLGDPVEHSLSPTFQNAGLQALGIDATYSALAVDGQALVMIGDTIRQGRLLGANITLPHKRLAFSAADEHTAAASSCGAANTWYRGEDGRLWAHNSDVHGIRCMAAALCSPEDAGNVVVLGAGGAAAAAVAALAPFAESTTIINRTVDRGEALLRATGVEGTVLPWPMGETLSDELLAAAERADLVVQATSLPLGPRGGAEAFLLLPVALFGEAVAALELCYSTEPTPFMQVANAVGVPTLDGATMLLHQGAESLSLWAQQPAPLAVMRDALAEAIERDPRAIPVEFRPERARAWGVTGNMPD